MAKGEDAGDAEVSASPLVMLRERNSRLLWAARVVSDFGSGATLGTLLLSLTLWTGSERVVAVNGLVQALPVVLLSWFAGSLVDRWDRRHVMIASDFLRAALVLILIFAGPHRIVLVFAVTAAQSLVGAFFDPANAALIPRIVPTHQRASANGLLQSSSMVADLAGVSFAGIIVGLTPDLWLAFVIDSATFAVAASLVALIRVDGRVHGKATPALMTAAREGLRFVRKAPLLLALIVGAAFTQLGFGVVNVTLAPFLLLILHTSPIWLGPATAALVISAVLTGLMTGRIARRVSSAGMVAAGLAISAAGILGLAGSPNVATLIVSLCVLGAAQTLLGTGAALILQNTVPDEIRGRVSAVARTTSQAGTIIGLSAVGLLAALVPIRGLLASAGFIVALATIYMVLSTRHARRASPDTSN